MRTSTGLRRLALVCSMVLLAGACSNTAPLGSTGACFAAEGDDEVANLTFREETRRGVGLVAQQNEVGAPPVFEACAQGMRVRAELIDEDGGRFWLALDARLADEELLPAALFTAIADAQIDVRLQRGFTVSDGVTIHNGDRLLVALQNDQQLQSPAGLDVTDSGADALPSMDSCGSVATHRLTFTDDERAQPAGNGQRVQLVVGGTEFLGFNIFTAERSAGNCDDGPFVGLHATWLAVDNSL